MFSFHCENNIFEIKYVRISNWISYMLSKFDIFVAVNHNNLKWPKQPLITASASGAVEIHPAIGLT